HRHHGDQIEVASRSLPSRTTGPAPTPPPGTSTPPPQARPQVGAAPPPAAGPRPASSPSVPKPMPDAPPAPAAPPPSPANRFRRMLELNPKDSDARFQLVHALMEEQRWPEAIQELGILQQQLPKNMEILNSLGWAQLNSGQVEPAFATWKKALTIDPKD